MPTVSRRQPRRRRRPRPDGSAGTTATASFLRSRRQLYTPFGRSGRRPRRLLLGCGVPAQEQRGGDHGATDRDSHGARVRLASRARTRGSMPAARRVTPKAKSSRHGGGAHKVVRRPDGRLRRCIGVLAAGQATPRRTASCGGPERDRDRPRISDDGEPMVLFDALPDRARSACPRRWRARMTACTSRTGKRRGNDSRCSTDTRDFTDADTGRSGRRGDRSLALRLQLQRNWPTVMTRAECGRCSDWPGRASWGAHLAVRLVGRTRESV